MIILTFRVVFQYDVWSQWPHSEKTNSQSNESLVRARQSIRPHGERRAADTQRLARLPAGQPGVSQSGPDPSLLLRPHLRGARLGRDTPGQQSDNVYLLPRPTINIRLWCHPERQHTQPWRHSNRTIRTFYVFFKCTECWDFYWTIEDVTGIGLNVKISIWINLN